MIKSKKQMYLVIGVLALVLMLGTVTYAFFNYTRTGTANTIRTGRISFNTSQSNTLNLTNVFPMSASDAGNANLDAVSVRIWGDTTYSGGEEYEISIVDVNNTIGSGASAKTIPINYIASYTATPVQSGDPNVIGTNSDSYFTARGQSSPVYQLSETGEATNGEQVLIGYIPSRATGIDGTLTIKAYLDSSKIAISDTYNASDPETDTNGTTTDWVAGRTVLTTSEWNELQNTQTPLSFKINAVSQEGTWIEDPTPPLPTMAEMCPNCYYGFGFGTLQFGTNGSVVQTNSFDLDYENVIADGNNDAFFGVVIDENSGKVSRVFACGMAKPTLTSSKIPFCVEGAQNNDERFQEIYSSNLRIINEIWGDDNCQDNGNSYSCTDAAGAYIGMASSAASSFIEYSDEYGIYDNIYANQPGRADFYNDW